jgi:cell division protein FtsX
MDYHELEKMTVIKLREEAKKFPDLKGVTAMKKEELVHALVEHLGIAVPDKKHKAASVKLDKSDLRKMMSDLRMSQKAARSKDDRKTVDTLRRRIHSLKRRLRNFD